VFAFPLAGPALVARASCPGGADVRTARFGFGFSNAGGFSGASSSSKSCVDQSFARHWTPRAFNAVASTRALVVEVCARESAARAILRIVPRRERPRAVGGRRGGNE
jgi:hypothetical protein